MNFLGKRRNQLLCLGLLSLFIMMGFMSCNPFVKIAKVSVVNDILFFSGTGVVRNSVTEVLAITVEGNGQSVTQTINSTANKDFSFRWSEGNGDFVVTISTTTIYTNDTISTNTASPADSTNPEYTIGTLGDGDEVIITITRASETGVYEYSRVNNY